MPTAIQLQFGYKFWQCERGFNVDVLMWIQFAFDVHQVNTNSIRIQTIHGYKTDYYFINSYTFCKLGFVNLAVSLPTNKLPCEH